MNLGDTNMSSGKQSPSTEKKPGILKKKKQRNCFPWTKGPKKPSEASSNQKTFCRNIVCASHIERACGWACKEKALKEKEKMRKNRDMHPPGGHGWFSPMAMSLPAWGPSTAGRWIRMATWGKSTAHWILPFLSCLLAARYNQTSLELGSYGNNPTFIYCHILGVYSP